MNNLMTFGNYQAKINFDPEINMFRGEFINLSGGADFYATDIENLHKEGKISLKMYLAMSEADTDDKQ